MPKMQPSTATHGRRISSAVLAACALAVLVAVTDRQHAAPVGLAASSLYQAAAARRLSVKQMLAESLRLQKEGEKFPTFDIPSSRSNRLEEVEQPISGPHALDWRKGTGDPETPPAALQPQYVAPEGFDRVDDPVGDKDGWVNIGARAFRVTRGEDGELDHLDVPGDARIRPVADGWEVDIPDGVERDRYNDHYQMRRGNSLRRSHFSDEEWAANRLTRKFYKADMDKSSRRDAAWQETSGEMDRAGWNEDNSMMPIHAANDAYDEGSSSKPDVAVTRDRFYHWVSKDGRTDTSREKPEKQKKAVKVPEVTTADDNKPSWLLVRPSITDGTIKVERDVSGAIKHVAVPVSAMVEASGSDAWEISFPADAAKLRAGQTHQIASVDKRGTVRVADAADPSNTEKVESVTPQWSSVSAPGDEPGEDAKVSSAASEGDSAATNGQNIDRAAYGIPERAPSPVTPTARARGDESPARNKRDGRAAPRQVWGGWESHMIPVVDVYAPNEDPFYCADGTEASICGTTGRHEQEHDYSLGWDGNKKAQRALAKDKSRDHAGELGEVPTHQAQGSSYRETPASADPYKYVRDGHYAKILKHEQDIVGKWRHVEMSTGEQRKDAEEMEKAAHIEHAQSMKSVSDKAAPHAKHHRVLAQPYQQRTGLTVPPLPYKVRAPYDGSLNRVGYPNMRGGMRSEDGSLLPYDDRSGSGNNVISHKEWASDVWARSSPFGVRDVRDSLNRNEEGGARRRVDEGGYHEYQAGNHGFHEALPTDAHDADDSRESQGLRVDQSDIVGDEEGRRRVARGGDGNADEYNSSRPAVKADYHVDVHSKSKLHEGGGDTEDIYIPYSDKAAWGASDLAAQVKGRAARRITERSRRQSQSLNWPDDRNTRTEHASERRDERVDGHRGGSTWDRDEDSMGWKRIREDATRYEQVHLKRQHDRDQTLLQRRQRRAARDAREAQGSQMPSVGHFELLSLSPLSHSAAAEQRVNEIAAAKLASQVSPRHAHLTASASARLAEERVNQIAARKLAAVQRIAQRQTSLTSSAGDGNIGKMAQHLSSWLGAYQRHAPLPPRTSLSAGVDAVDRYNKAALAHILSSAHGGDAEARLTARQAVMTLKNEEHPRQLELRRSLQRSASLRSSLGDYLDDYGSGPQDAAAADGINL